VDDSLSRLLVSISARQLSDSGPPPGTRAFSTSAECLRYVSIASQCTACLLA
jgi:hypothetical protein